MSDLPTPLLFVDAPAAPETFNVLLFGKPKSGKSTAAATAPGPLMWVNAEGPGALGYARKVAGQLGSEIFEVELSSDRRRTVSPSDVLDQVYRHVRDRTEPVVQTVVVDTVAKVRDALVAQYVDKGSKNSLKQYGVVADKLGGFITAMRDLPVNLVLLAHVDLKEDAEQGRIVDPLIGGKLTETIPGEVDVLAYTASWVDDEDGKRRYYGQLVEAKGRPGGERSGALGGDKGFRELDLSEWLQTYREALTPVVDNSDLPFELDPDAVDVEDDAADVVDQATLLDADEDAA